jgi:hypothetical protein
VISPISDNTLTRDRYPRPGGIRTQNPSNREAADMRLRSRGNPDRLRHYSEKKIYINARTGVLTTMLTSFRFSGDVTPCLLVNIDISKAHSASTFMLKQSKKCWTLNIKTLRSFRRPGVKSQRLKHSHSTVFVVTLGGDGCDRTRCCRLHVAFSQYSRSRI